MRIVTFATLGVTALAGLLLLAQGCGSSTGDSGFFENGDSGPGTGKDGGGTGSDGSFIMIDGSSPDTGHPPCSGLQCQIHDCTGGTPTTISGKIYDPAGRNPLYNVVVYVPNSTPKALPKGASCDSCDTLYTGDPIAVGLTDAQGNFKITNAPDGPNIPIVIQVGKWRKQTTIANVVQCADNPQPDKSLRLPSKRDPKNDIPDIAISTGGADTMECLLSRIGVDKSEYVGGTGNQAIHIYVGSGGNNTSPGGPASPNKLWDSKPDLMQYDIVILSCEGSETSNPNSQNLHDYAASGGRVFASHFHYAFFNQSPFSGENLATWSPGTNDIGDITGDIVTTLPNGQPFPKGQALKDWLTNVGALTNNQLPIQQARHNADVSASNTPSQNWILVHGSQTEAQYFSWNTPINAPVDDAGVPQYCGRVVYSDLHVGAASGDYAISQTVPTGCANNALSPQEKALEFMLFDLSSCVTPNNVPPQPPTPPPPK